MEWPNYFSPLMEMVLIEGELFLQRGHVIEKGVGGGKERGTEEAPAGSQAV